MNKKLIQEFYNLLGKKVSFERVSALNIRYFDGLPENEDNGLWKMCWEKLGNLKRFMIENDFSYVVFTLKDNKFKKRIENFLSTNEVPKIKLQKVSVEELNGFNIPYFKKPIESEGLDGVKAEDIYKAINDQLLDYLKKGIGEYKKRWETKASKDGYLIAYNFDSKKPYKSVNALTLGANPLFGEPLDNPYYLTFKQIEKRKGKLKKGSKGHKVIYYTILYKVKDKKAGIDFGTYDKNKFKKFLINNKLATVADADKKADYFTIPILKYYNVFNGADVEGIDFDLENFDLRGKYKHLEDPNKRKPHEDNLTAEAIVANYPKLAPKIKHEKQDRAFYNHSDFIMMPLKDQFFNPNEYYGTLFHELVHSTGAPDRLARKFGRSKGDKNYAFEELVAEIGSSYLCAEAGILHLNIKNSVGYLKGWASVLVKNVAEDPKYLFKACSLSEKANEFILQKDKEGIPLYFRNNSIKKRSQKKKITKIKKDSKKVDRKAKLVGSKSKNNTEKLKVDSKGQTALFGLGLVPFSEQIKSNPKPNQTYKIGGAIRELLGDIEIKPSGSVAVTIDAPQGAGKTTFAFQFIEEFAKNGYKCLFPSLEEHKDSNIFKDKANRFLSAKAKQNFYPVSDLENDFETLKQMIPHFDVIIVDSWNKLLEINKNISFDNDLRKAFDGKLFLCIFQRTVTGTMRGGSSAGFDGDIILRMHKDEDFSKNFVYADKNRYNGNPVKYNVATQSIIKEVDPV